MTEIKEQENFAKRLSYRRWKKMRSHVDEMQASFLERVGGLKNMIDAGMEEEQNRTRKSDKRKNNKGVQDD